MMYEHLLVETKGQIAIVSINNPKTLNALNKATLRELNACLSEIEQGKDIRVIIVTGAGTKAFVAGADISEMANDTPAEGRAMSLLGKEVLSRLEVSDAKVSVVDMGALDCTIKARVECAVFRGCGISDNYPWGGALR